MTSALGRRRQTGSPAEEPSPGLCWPNRRHLLPRRVCRVCRRGLGQRPKARNAPQTSVEWAAPGRRVAMTSALGRRAQVTSPCAARRAGSLRLRDRRQRRPTRHQAAIAQTHRKRAVSEHTSEPRKGTSIAPEGGRSYSHVRRGPRRRGGSRRRPATASHGSLLLPCAGRAEHDLTPTPSLRTSTLRTRVSTCIGGQHDQRTRQRAPTSGARAPRTLR